MSKQSYNPFLMAQAQFDKVAESLALEESVRELLRFPLREYHLSIPVRMDDGKRPGVPRLPRPAQRRPRPGQGRNPLPSPGDRRHGARPGHVDDLEMLGRGHPPGRRQGRGGVRSPQPEPAGAGADLPRLDPPAGPRYGSGPRRAGAGRDDQRPAHAVDAGRVRDDPGRTLPRLHHRQAGGHGRLAGPHRGHRLRRWSSRAGGAEGAGTEARGHDRQRPGLRQRGPATPSSCTSAWAARCWPWPAGTRATRPATPTARRAASTWRSCWASPTASAGSTRPRPRTWATSSCPARPGWSRTWTS